MLLGSDCLIFGAGRAVHAAEAVGLDATAWALVFRGNVRRLFG